MNIRTIYGSVIADKVATLPVVESGCIRNYLLQTDDGLRCCVIGAANYLAAKEHQVFPMGFSASPTERKAHDDARRALKRLLSDEEKETINEIIAGYDEMGFDPDYLAVYVRECCGITVNPVDPSPPQEG